MIRGSARDYYTTTVYSMILGIALSVCKYLILVDHLYALHCKLRQLPNPALSLGLPSYSYMFVYMGGSSRRSHAYASTSSDDDEMTKLSGLLWQFVYVCRLRSPEVNLNVERIVLFRIVTQQQCMWPRHHFALSLSFKWLHNLANYKIMFKHHCSTIASLLWV